MDMHHKLRRDPNWHPNGCNLCGQLGHQASQCTTGTINWRAIYGDEEFVLRPPIYHSDIAKRKAYREDGMKEIEKRAAEYAKAQAEAQGLEWEEILSKGKQLHTIDPKDLIKPIVQQEEVLPPGWAVAHDAAGKPYFWHKETKKVQWDKPTDDTPL